MATNFPASLDSLTNPTSSDSLNSPSHSAQHANANDAIEALQAKVGVDSSAVTSSLDYKVAQLEAVSHGKILQVVEGNTSSAVQSTSGTPSDTGITVNITPSDTANKVLVFVGINYQLFANNGTYSDGKFDLLRDATTLDNLTLYHYQSGPTGGASQIQAAGYMSYLDTPSSTSALTYKVQQSVITPGSGRAVGVLGTWSNIVAMEVSA